MEVEAIAAALRICGVNRYNVAGVWFQAAGREGWPLRVCQVQAEAVGLRIPKLQGEVLEEC